YRAPQPLNEPLLASRFSSTSNLIAMTHPTRGPQDHPITMEISRIQSALQAQGFTIHPQHQPPTWTIYRAKSHQAYQLSF
ncbi:MAG: hypothetical protein WBA10_06515, partial [Elainellaceae cyanobacterium]